MTLLETYAPGVAINGGFTKEHPFMIDGKPDPKNEYMSYSRLSKFRQSPLSFKRRYIDGEKDESTSSTDKGHIVHNALLEPHKLMDSFVVKPKFSGEGAVKKRKAWEEANKDSIVITQGVADEVAISLEKIEEDPKINALLSNGEAEIFGHAWDEEYGVMWLCKFDYARPDGVIIELKTAVDAKWKKFQWSVDDFGYHIQAWVYHRVFSLITGMTPQVFMPVVMIGKPYGVNYCGLPAIAVEETGYEIRFLLEKMEECKRDGYYPLELGPKVIPLVLPNSAKWRVEELIEGEK